MNIIYADTLFALSVFTDYLLLVVTARFCSLRLRRWRYLAAAVLGGDKVQALRQVAASDNATARTIMWQSPVQLTAPMVELSGGAGDGKTFPAQEESFTDDGVSSYLYTAQVTGLTAGKTYSFTVKAVGMAKRSLGRMATPLNLARSQRGILQTT